MFGFTWLTLRQIREAIKQGRLDEAARLLETPAIREHRQGGELLTQLARGFVERGERALEREEPERAWADLETAHRLGVADKSADKLRRELISFQMAQLRALLLAGEIARADEVRLSLRQREVRSPELLVLEEGLQGWMRAVELAELGEISLALESLERVRRLLGVNPRLDALWDDWSRRRAELPEALARLQQAAVGERWAEVVERAEEVLALAPQQPEARALRSRAWRATEPATLAHPGCNETVSQEPLPPRFLLWIDGVGGYLVCLSPHLTFGQAGPQSRVDVPLLADVSRLHAGLHRDGESYILEAMKPVLVNEKSTTRTLLNADDIVTLGASCRFAFRLPVPANNSARIDLLSGHRLPAGVDGVLLMAQTLILGDGVAHARLDSDGEAVILFQNKESLGLVCREELRINDNPATGRVLLPSPAVVIGKDFSFAIEPAV
jgi:hypothetical protein